MLCWCISACQRGPSTQQNENGALSCSLLRRSLLDLHALGAHAMTLRRTTIKHTKCCTSAWQTPSSSPGAAHSRAWNVIRWRPGRWLVSAAMSDCCVSVGKADSAELGWAELDAVGRPQARSSSMRRSTSASLCAADRLMRSLRNGEARQACSVRTISFILAALCGEPPADEGHSFPLTSRIVCSTHTAPGLLLRR